MVPLSYGAASHRGWAKARASAIQFPQKRSIDRRHFRHHDRCGIDRRSSPSRACC